MDLLVDEGSDAEEDGTGERVKEGKRGCLRSTIARFGVRNGCAGSAVRDWSKGWSCF